MVPPDDDNGFKDGKDADTDSTLKRIDIHESDASKKSERELSEKKEEEKAPKKSDDE